jgi:hypothetical protein
MRLDERAVRRFWSYLDRSGECWLWTGALGTSGYGQFWVDGHNTIAHRTSYKFFVGEIPDGHQVDHLCGVRRCVNPDHLESVTPRVNTLRSNGHAATVVRTNRCKRGHEFTPENTYWIRSDSRGCRTCRAAATRRWRNRQKKGAGHAN